MSRRCSSPGGTPSPPRWGTAGTGADSAGTRATTAVTTATRSGSIAQLEVDLADGTRRTVVTDESWVAATGEIQSADLYDGVVIDLRERQLGFALPGFAPDGWRPVRVVPFDRSTIVPRTAPPVRVVATLPVQRITRSDGTLLLDGGQNIAGYVHLRVKGRPGSRVTVRHAEMLEPDGSLHTRSLRSAKATDTFVLADEGVSDLEPRLTFHGFRYAEVASEAEIIEATFVAISSDTPRRGWFSCSDPTLERFHENVVWSQRDNFVSVPTDCPQRDERLGWTGDAQAFAATGSTLFDAQAFWASWLRDLALDQDDDLGAPTVVPDVVVTGGSRFGRAGWADAATIVPWSVYEAYGDAHVLIDQLDSMKRWIGSSAAALAPMGSCRRACSSATGSTPTHRSTARGRRRPTPPISPTRSSSTARVWQRTPRESSATLRGRMRRGAWPTPWRGRPGNVGGTMRGKTQTGCAVALRFGLVPDAERGAVADALARLVREADGRVSTGFLGTPLVLPALSDAGRFEEAYLMLLRQEMPSWLYQVRMGATTVWERWDAIRPDGSIHPGTMKTPPEMADRKEGEPHMLSFNHYAYGAVIDWVYRNVAGLAPDLDRPGYRHVILAPKPVAGLKWAKASVDSPYGLVAIEWRVGDSGHFEAGVDLPFGTTGHVRAAGHGCIAIDRRRGREQRSSAARTRAPRPVRVRSSGHRCRR